MTHRDRDHKHNALMLLACAFAFVYLLAWQFQWDHALQQWQWIAPPALPEVLTNITSPSVKQVIDTSWSEIKAPSSWEIVTNSSWNTLSFSSLNALPQSFVRLWLSNTQNIMIDQQRTIVTTDTNHITWKWESKTLTWSELQSMWINAKSLTFYNDPSWVNILVVMEIVNNNQSLLVQVPYASYRDDKEHLNSLIYQLTQ